MTRPTRNSALLLALAFVALVFIFLSASAADIAPAKVYVISEHGAVGDGQTLNTRSIQATIDRCAIEGGGVLVVPEGTFVTGSIFLKQGVHLRVEKGGVLKGSQDTNDYPWIDTRIAGFENEMARRVGQCRRAYKRPDQRSGND